MIRYALICHHDHEFEGWFSNSADFDTQQKAGLFTGAALLLCNPKVHVITLLMFAQFPIAPEDPDALQKVIVISAIFTLNNCVAFAFWTLMGEQILRGFRIGATQEVLQRVFGLSLMFVSGWMLV